MFDITVSDGVAMAQLFCSIIGGGFALYLYCSSIKERKQVFRMSLYDRIYGNSDILRILYEADKKKVIKPLEEKIDRAEQQTEVERVYYVAEFEKEADIALKYLDYIGSLLMNRIIEVKDLESFRYEIEAFTNHQTIKRYIKYLMSLDKKNVLFKGLVFLIKELNSTKSIHYTNS